MNTLSLRGQLIEKKPAAPGAAPDEPLRATQCFRASDNAPGLKIASGETISAFPYSHFLYAQLRGENALVIRFATHRVLIMGTRLEVLLDELTAQRLELVHILPKRLSGQVEGGVWVERIEVSEIGAHAPADSPGTARTKQGVAAGTAPSA